MPADRFRYFDSWHFAKFNQDNATAYAADDIINSPETHLLTQNEIFDAEGGIMGLATQLAVVGLGIGALLAVRPKMGIYLKNA